MYYVISKDAGIYHSGIKGMKWGIRRYQNPDGSYTEEGKMRRRGHSNATDTAEDSDKKRIDSSTKKKLIKVAVASAVVVGAAYTAKKLVDKQALNGVPSSISGSGKDYLSKCFDDAAKKPSTIDQFKTNIVKNAKAAPGEFLNRVADAPTKIAQKAGDAPVKILGAVTAGIMANMTMNTLNKAMGEQRVKDEIGRYNALNKKDKINLGAFDKKKDDSSEDDEDD